MQQVVIVGSPAWRRCASLRMPHLWLPCKPALPCTSGSSRQARRPSPVVCLQADCSSLLPVYCFDPRDYGKSPQGYDRTGGWVRTTGAAPPLVDLCASLC